MQRMKLLGDQPYICCMGAFPCLCLGDACDPVPWLCCEVVFCTICAVTANRAYIQRSKQVQNDACDDCLIWCLCICQFVICCLEMLGQPVDPALENAVDCFYYIVIGCMLTQQDIEINPNFQPPPTQTMMQQQQPMPVQLETVPAQQPYITKTV